MNFIIIFGPAAVGKMTVGQELSKITGYPLLHNHMTIDVVTELFDFGTPQFDRLVPAFRRMLVSEAAASDLAGLIFTFIWALDVEDDKLFLDELRDTVSKYGGKTLYAELEADQEKRVARNVTENRLRHKKKADTVKTEAVLRDLDARHVLNSSGNFPYPERHVKITNTHLAAREAAAQIVAAFDLPAQETARSG